MSLYELVFGNGEAGLPLLGALGFKRATDVGRYRSAWLEKGEDGKPRIAVYTRNGGGNRKDYEKEFEALRKHPNYLFDRDDSFDSTYATIYFSVPERLESVMDRGLPGWREKLTAAIDMSQVWQEAIKKLGGGP